MTSISADFIEAVRCRARVTGFTHNFYRYPARFSPLFARAAIQSFTEPGDTVLDPFMGGGTTLVEACTLGRQAVGTDINSLSVFISRVKTTSLSDSDLNEVGAWVEVVVNDISLHDPVERQTEWAEKGYHRNISDRRTWPIRKMLELALPTTDLLPTEHQRSFARCVLLKTAQWALDCRRDIPPMREFRKQLLLHFDEMRQGAEEFSRAITSLRNNRHPERALCLHRSAASIDAEPSLRSIAPPRLIVTSPPYPGVHVLYHRWQVRGRRETPAPYWIANSLDGEGVSFYNFGDRRQPGLAGYYDAAYSAFRSLARIATDRTLVVQMIAFSDPKWQLPEYLAVMERAGFSEIIVVQEHDSEDGRLWRSIPNRKFYADQKGETKASKEVVLFHRRSRPTGR